MWLSLSSGDICRPPLPSSLLDDSLVPRPFEGRRKGLVHTICACSIILRILGYRILSYTFRLQIRVRAHVLQFVTGHVPFEPHSDSVIRLHVNQFQEISLLICPSSDHEGYWCWKGLTKKLISGRFCCRSRFQGKFDCCTGEWFLGSFAQCTIGNKNSLYLRKTWNLVCIACVCSTFKTAPYS